MITLSRLAVVLLAAVALSVPAITAQDEVAKQTPRWLTYPIADLPVWTRGETQTFDPLLLTSLCEVTLGEDSDVVFRPNKATLSVVIRATPSEHDQIKDVLDNMRKDIQKRRPEVENPEGVLGTLIR